MAASKVQSDIPKSAMHNAPNLVQRLLAAFCIASVSLALVGGNAFGDSIPNGSFILPPKENLPHAGPSPIPLEPNPPIEAKHPDSTHDTAQTSRRDPANPILPREHTKSSQNDLTDSPVYRLYPGISVAQSALAHEGLRLGYNGDFTGAARQFSAMEALEKRDSLPPLSQLLTVATGVLILERGDQADSADAARIAHSITQAAEHGRYLCKTALSKHKKQPTYALILGGIKGFLATRKIHTQPTRALQDGYQAMRQLQRTLDYNPGMKDAYMGKGIFDCTASNAPLVVRGALKLLGHSSNFKQGLKSLRISAYEGQYTSVASQFYLIQFLSPYEDESRQEKRVLFASLRASFPRNPMYAFLQNDEALCFYPDSFWTKTSLPSLPIERSLRRLKPMGYAGERYLNLLKWQYSLLQPEGKNALPPDANFDLREWKFYPVFIEGLRRKREFEDSLKTRDPGVLPKEVMAAYRDSATILIRQSAFTPTAKRYHEWRVRDALRLSKNAGASYAEPTATD